MPRPVPAPGNYPYPVSQRLEDSPIEEARRYTEECNTWARRLPEMTLRELASDYMRGQRDECTEDAYNEYVRREKAQLLSNQKPPASIKKARNKAKRDSSRKRSRRA